MAVISDYNTDKRLASNVARGTAWADLDLSLAEIVSDGHTHDIRPLTDLDAIRNSVKNLVLTNFYERPFQPFTGGNISSLLFEPADRFTSILLKARIVDVLAKYEPRVTNVVVSVSDDSVQNNRYNITIGFTAAGIAVRQAEIQFYLERVR